MVGGITDSSSTAFPFLPNHRKESGMLTDGECFKAALSLKNLKKHYAWRDYLEPLLRHFRLLMVLGDQIGFITRTGLLRKETRSNKIEKPVRVWFHDSERNTYGGKVPKNYSMYITHILDVLDLWKPKIHESLKLYLLLKTNDKGVLNDIHFEIDTAFNKNDHSSVFPLKIQITSLFEVICLDDLRNNTGEEPDDETIYFHIQSELIVAHSELYNKLKKRINDKYLELTRAIVREEVTLNLIS